MRIHRNSQWLNSGLAVFLVAASSLFATVGYAQGEHGRRVAAELAVLAGDLRKLENSDTAEHHAAGLRLRIEGAMVALDILTRLADMEVGNAITPRFNQIAAMRDDFSGNRTVDVARSIAALRKLYPLVAPTIVIEDVAEFAELHQTHCSACHDHPVSSVPRPAFNLSKQTIDTPVLEMFARMLVGVRGDRVTGIDNPLSDRQILGLLEYYRSKQ